MDPQGPLSWRELQRCCSMAWVGWAWTGAPGLLSGLQSWRSQLVIPEVAVRSCSGGNWRTFPLGKALCDTSVKGLEFLGAMQVLAGGFAALDASCLDARKGSVGRIPLKPQGIKCAGWNLGGHLPPDSHPVALPFTLPKPPVPPLPSVWEEPPKTPSVTLLCPFGLFSANQPFLSSSPLPSSLIISQCSVCLLLSGLPGNGTKEPREALPRSRACSHRDICRGKCSLFQQTAGVQRHKHTQINRFTPPAHLKRVHTGRCFSGPGWSHSESQKCRWKDRIPPFLLPQQEKMQGWGTNTLNSLHWLPWCQTIWQRSLLV